MKSEGDQYLLRRIATSLLTGILAMALSIAAPAARSENYQVTPQQADAARDQVNKVGRRGFLFEATRGQQRLFVYGGAVLGKEDLFPFNPPLLSALILTQRLLLDRDTSNSTALAERAIAIGTLPNGERVGRYLPAPLMQAAGETLTAYGLQPLAMSRYKPWLIALALSDAVTARSGLHPGRATVLFLQSYAAASNLPIVALESPTLEYEELNALPMAIQNDYLAQVIDDTRSGRALERMELHTRAWALGDNSLLAHYWALSRGANGPNAQFFLTDFQIARVDKLADALIRDLSNPGVPLLVVPAHYLYGDSGLLHVLNLRGFTLRDLQP